jgi:hypothetical protein
LPIANYFSFHEVLVTFGHPFTLKQEIRSNDMSKIIAVGFLFFAILTLVLCGTHGVGAQGSHHSEQVVFSGDADSSEGGIDFWIHCEDESNNRNQGTCSGAIHVDDPKLTRSVSGSVTEDEATGAYTIIVASKDGSIAATFVNTPPVSHGPHNTVTVTFDTPGGQGTAVTDTAVVNVTGKED